jgi:hypothetical protein
VRESEVVDCEVLCDSLAVLSVLSVISLVLETSHG